MSTLQVIGELMNHSYARARRAWRDRSLEGYQQLAKLQTELGASCLTLNLDGTRQLSVRMEEMIDFLPRLLPALQEVTDLPISFDNPNLAFHEEAMRHFQPGRCRGRPLLNSLAVSRTENDGMIRLIHKRGMRVIVMASECLRPDGRPGPAATVSDIVETARHFVHRLRAPGAFENDRVIVDPGLASIASDTEGRTLLALDAIRALRNDPDLAGVHSMVGLSNFAIGAPERVRIPMERAFLRLAVDAGMDRVLANPEKNTEPLNADHPLVHALRRILESCRPQSGESKEDAGFRQLDELMELWNEFPEL